METLSRARTITMWTLLILNCLFAAFALIGSVGIIFVMLFTPLLEFNFAIVALLVVTIVLTWAFISRFRGLFRLMWEVWTRADNS